jgi:hypothetical protein
LSNYQFPYSSFPYAREYIYHYLNYTNASAASVGPIYGQTTSQFLPPGATDVSAQPLLPAGGAPGGNLELYNVLFTLMATITNNGTVKGEEVSQIYVSLGGPNDPVVVLRSFERLSIDAGMSTTFAADLTRRDLSNWDPISQNWVIKNYAKTVYVGAGSRELYISQTLSSTM